MTSSSAAANSRSLSMVVWGRRCGRV
ncbi:cytochrome b6-f complex subunit PetN [Nocardia beijingensis]